MLSQGRYGVRIKNTSADWKHLDEILTDRKPTRDS